MYKKTKLDLPKPEPCPFCGEMKQAQRYDQLMKVYWVMCKECLCQGPPMKDVIDAILVWNRRS